MTHSKLNSDTSCDICYDIIQEHDCRLTRDIVELIDREADLIMRAIPDPSLGGETHHIMISPQFIAML